MIRRAAGVWEAGAPAIQGSLRPASARTPQITRKQAKARKIRHTNHHNHDKASCFFPPPPATVSVVTRVTSSSGGALSLHRRVSVGKSTFKMLHIHHIQPLSADPHPRVISSEVINCSPPPSQLLITHQGTSDASAVFKQEHEQLNFFTNTAFRSPKSEVKLRSSSTNESKRPKCDV